MIGALTAARSGKDRLGSDTIGPVTTPVPPTPARRIPNESAFTPGGGAGSSSAAIGPAACTRLADARGTTVMNAGQSPSRQL